MSDNREENSDDGHSVSKLYDDIERENEDRFVKFMIEIMVSLTLKELYGQENDDSHHS